MIVSDAGGTNFEQPPAGAHVARCIRIIDIGTQKGEYQGQPTFKHQFIMGWELSNELMTSGDSAGKPFTVSKFYTASLNEKAALRKDLASWRTRDFTEEELKGFDVQSVLGKACMLSITLNDKGKAKVSAVMALPKGTQVPAQVNKTVNFSINKFDEEVFNALSDGIKKLIIPSPEFQAMRSTPKDDANYPDPRDDGDDSSIPF
jgi:hypothetical protein